MKHKIAVFLHHKLIIKLLVLREQFTISCIYQYLLGNLQYNHQTDRINNNKKTADLKSDSGIPARCIYDINYGTYVS